MLCFSIFSIFSVCFYCNQCVTKHIFIFSSTKVTAFFIQWFWFLCMLMCDHFHNYVFLSGGGFCVFFNSICSCECLFSLGSTLSTTKLHNLISFIWANHNDIVKNSMWNLLMSFKSMWKLCPSHLLIIYKTNNNSPP